MRWLRFLAVCRRGTVVVEAKKNRLSKSRMCVNILAHAVPRTFTLNVLDIIPPAKQAGISKGGFETEEIVLSLSFHSYHSCSITFEKAIDFPFDI